ncbi:hypothetical protein MAC_00648 [Metarhizium acridum CQMa 102]|uniref:ACB domain-containing protein n=1 Tax=Metarhizium acridum (strain CQMa 102) TaxID=655827 RepID=E9DSQ0_METAQ|nr:uncharacterized protein MAC_00648 [Metarhizium acridum CQMa 102]EFY93410.1 hypothetical protein MAC_00648 [Metarhizium acridum CQMa 102]
MSVNTSNQAFNDAANIEAQKLKGHLSQDDMLRLYSFFKIAKGDDITTEAAPGMFDLAVRNRVHLTFAAFNFVSSFQFHIADIFLHEQRKKMRASWKARVDEGVTVEEAQKKYIELVEELKKDKQIQ